MNFYFNKKMNLCANEYWVAKFLVYNDDFDSVEQATDILLENEGFDGWVPCAVSDDIEEACWSQFVKNGRKVF